MVLGGVPNISLLLTEIEVNFCVRKKLFVSEESIQFSTYLGEFGLEGIELIFDLISGFWHFSLSLWKRCEREEINFSRF